jgi:hypothetical protein
MKCSSPTARENIGWTGLGFKDRVSNLVGIWMK